MPPKILKFSHPVDRKVWLGYLRQLLYLSLSLFLVALGCGLSWSWYQSWLDYKDREEWRGVALQQGEGVCVRTVDTFAQTPFSSPRDSDTVQNTFRIGGVERISRDQGSCVPGKRYALSYQIGRTGRLKIESGKSL